MFLKCIRLWPAAHHMSSRLSVGQITWWSQLKKQVCPYSHLLLLLPIDALDNALVQHQGTVPFAGVKRSLLSRGLSCLHTGLSLGTSFAEKDLGRAFLLLSEGVSDCRRFKGLPITNGPRAFVFYKACQTEQE